MDTSDIDNIKEEYYETLEEHASLKPILNASGGLILARVGSYPPWPARFSEPGEFATMIKYRKSKGQLCVYFFGSRNYGWVNRNAIQAFTIDLPHFVKPTKKPNAQLLQDALAEAKILQDLTDETTMRFYDRVMERRHEPADLPCAICNRVDDHYSLLILCDGKDCKKEYHMNCLSPPLLTVPEGDWFCPECAATNGTPVSSSTSIKKPLIKRESPIKRMATTAPTDQLIASADLPTPTSQKKKREKPMRENSFLKRKLLVSTPNAETTTKPSVQSTTPVVYERPPSKKQKAQPSPVLPQPPPSSNPSTPTSSPHRRAHQQLDYASTGSAENGNTSSEEKCFVCSYGGELIVCEFPLCTKVYHQFCLGAFPFPKDEDAIWYCPRHTCAITGQKELPIDPINPPNAKAQRKQLLWKCTQCPLALSSRILPTLPVGQIIQKKARHFICPYCFYNSPVLVQFARVLERIWSTIATNRQGMPFCGPLLCGVKPPTRNKRGSDPPGSNSSPKITMDLFKILAKIRRLAYTRSQELADDIHMVVEQAIAIISERSQPLIEAAKTLDIMCNEQFAIHHAKLMFLDGRIRRMKQERKLQAELIELEKKWPIPWRKECGPFDGKYYNEIESQTLDEWTAYVTAAPLYVDCSDVHKEAPIARSIRTGFETPVRLEPEETNSNTVVHFKKKAAKASAFNGNAAPATSSSAGNQSPSRSEARPAVVRASGLTLSEGRDVMMALAELASGGDGRQRSRLGGHVESDIESIDGRSLFFSPSISEMEHMFTQQSLLLRRALEAHTTLYKAWTISQQQILGIGRDNRAFSIGEGRIAAELRLANQNLHARLQHKDKLIEQLTSDQLSLHAQVKQMELDLQEMKQKKEALEAQMRSSGDQANEATDQPSEALEIKTKAPDASSEAKRTGPSPRGRNQRRTR